MLKFVLLLISYLIISTSAICQAILNLDFEPGVNNGIPTMFWNFRDNPNYRIDIDTVVRYKGKGSLLFDGRNKKGSIRAVLASFPVRLAKGKTLTFTGHFKSDSPDGGAGLDVSILEGEKMKRLDALNSFSNKLSSESWKEISVKVPVTANVQSISLIIDVMGSGKKWVDDLKIYLNDTLYEDIPLPGTEPFLIDSISYVYPKHVFFEEIVKSHKNASPYEIRTNTSSPNSSTLIIDGSKALKISNSTAILKVLSVDTLLGKELMVKGAFKKEDFSESRVELYFAFLSGAGKFKRISHYQTYSLDSPISKDRWEKFSEKIIIPSHFPSKKVSIGINVYGKGILEVSKLELFVDGKPYEELSPQAPTPNEIKWLKSNIKVLTTTDPLAIDQDLLPLKSNFKDIRIVGLGESTHGSHEIFQMKHRLIRFLAEHNGFNTFAIEADMGAAIQLNEYVLNGIGDARDALKSLNFWVWDNQELLDLILWMRNYNEKNKSKIQFTGVDMQSPLASTENIFQFSLQHDSVMVQTAKDLKALFLKHNTRVLFANKKDSLSNAVKNKLALLHQRIDMEKIKTGASKKDILWVEQNINIIKQYTKLMTISMEEGNIYRDSCMAENMIWIAEQNPESKIVLWAHNYHVTNIGEKVYHSPYHKPMGQRLKEYFGKNYVSLGFAFDRGSYTSSPNRVSTVTPSYPGTYECYFEAAKIPVFYMDLRPIKPNKENKWLFKRLLFRDIGVFASEGEDFTRGNIKKGFDMMIYIDKCSPSQKINNKRK